MIDFACKKFDIEEVIKCSLGLSRSDFKILKFLMKTDDSFSTEELSGKMELDKSTIQRSVKKLHSKNLLTRGQVNQTVGGYLFFYRVKEKDRVKKIILDIVDGWVDNVRRGIQNW